MVHQGMGNEPRRLVSYARSLAIRRGSATVPAPRSRWEIWGAMRSLGRSDDAQAFFRAGSEDRRRDSDARGQARMLTDLAELARQAGDIAGAQKKLTRANGSRPRRACGNSNSKRCWELA